MVSDKLDQGDRNIRLDRAKFIDLRPLSQDIEWLLEMWENGPYKVEMLKLL